MVPSPVPQWPSDSPGETCHCHRVLLLGKANPECTHQEEAISVLAPFLLLPASMCLCVCKHLLSGFLSSPVPPSSSVPVLQLSQHLAGFGPGLGYGSHLLISTGLSCYLPRWEMFFCSGQKWNWECTHEKQQSSPESVKPRFAIACVCVSSPCVTNAILSSLRKLARAPMSLLVFLMFQKNYCNVIIIDFSTIHTR